MNLPNDFIIFDLEFTAWEGSKERNWSRKGEYREIYDIGAVLVAGKNYEVKNTFRQLVTLELVPSLPQYSVDLTGITQKDIDTNGILFSEMLKKFEAFVDNRDIYAWGHDGDILQENCQLKSVENPFSMKRFNNMREVFKEHGIPADDYHISTIVEYFGEKNKHTAHQGLDDALNIVEALRLLKRSLS